MQPPITVGTVLQNRYRIIQILGQGGFGRTYLAEDQRRFNELCAIKELNSTARSALDWERAQELFHREAAILYQIEHPQVPKFRERFEQDQRLFLVEDYVAGQTYRTLLAERQAVGKTFTEAEVLQLIQMLLPVLEHIHSRGIIHRDISPENIILRDSDAKPVLIDFGVVKELATRLRSPDNPLPETTVGKLGYSPSEQMQTGGAYPSSDLYALAVSAIVLLTGKEPKDLFDQNQLTWNWQRWVKVNPRFAQVLNRMLNHIPSDRYQSAASVSQALQPLQEVSLPNVNVSNLQTMAVSRRPDLVAPAASPKKPAPVIPSSPSSSILDNPLAIAAIGIAVVIVAGFGSWALVSSIRSQSKTPDETLPQNFPSPVISGGTTFTPTPTPTFTPTPTPTPTPTNDRPVVSTKRLKLTASKPTTVEGTLKANQIIQYSFFGREGAKLNTFIDPGSSILLTVLSPNGQPIENTAQQVTFYQGTLLVTGRYTIELTLLSGVAESNYNLNVGLEKPVKPTSTEAPLPIPTETPLPIPTETPLPIPTETPLPIPTETPLPIPTETPLPIPTITEAPTLPPTDGTQPFSGQRN
ncbi:serine/threonine-protein kinase [Nostoc sp. 'Lobaria pulmonaria (5183) cyanobiont']|uniref:serine/threonine-protein kinase n=1 Tax=Nostoc sp. 'Lobaria pulmonaria (5183) cyanobiont' TaxID=1618022 RepID=UPI000CF34F4D|nr:serine/threonine-protein kinase [Nostoc sp. 'Lobaria pulmonaria (5183) cyanobiont']AVH70399.1 serine/threonine protein kinase [Nostoc sp. 'Lobaria pulmonaria (5183) cyanobiont']